MGLLPRSSVELVRQRAPRAPDEEGDDATDSLEAQRIFTVSVGSSLPRAAELRDHGAALELNTAWQPRFAAEPCSMPADDPPVGGLIHDVQRCLLVRLSFLSLFAGTLWFVRGFAGGLGHRRRPTAAEPRAAPTAAERPFM